MKIQPIQKYLRSDNAGLLRSASLSQIKLLSILLLNLTLTSFSTIAKASEAVIQDLTQQSFPVELTPTSSIASFTGQASHPLSVDMVAAAAIATVNPPVQPIQSLEPTPSPMPLADGDPTTQPFSQKASDLAGVSTPQTSAPTTLVQTENSPPLESSSNTQSVNNPPVPPPGWRVDFEPYLFLPLDVQGDIFFGRGRTLLFPNRPGVILGNGGVNLNVNARLSNITAKLTNIFGVSGRFQAWNGNFGVVSEGLYVNSGFRSSSDGDTITFRDRFNLPIPGFQIDTKETLSSFSLGGSYRFLTVPFRTITHPSDPSNYYPAISFEALVGFRYLSVFQSVAFQRGPRFEFSGSEINPMLGGTAKLMLNDTLALFFRGDTSNLGGGNLKQYYNLYGGVDWKFSRSFALRLAYRFNQIEFVKQGRLNGDNGLNLRSQGVQLGVSWQF